MTEIILPSETPPQFDESARRDEAFEFQGALNLMHRMHENLGANLIHGIMKVEDEKLWRRMGYKSFVDYLNSDKVPFGSTKFYDLKKLLKHEKPEAFNFLSDRKISRLTRLLLAENNVAIELDADTGEIVIQGNRAPADDTAAVIELVNAVKDSLVLRDHRENADKKATEKATKKLKKDLEERDRMIANLQNTNFNALASSPHMLARLDLGIAYNRMREAVLALSTIEKDQFSDDVLEDIARWSEDIRVCYKTDTPRQKPAIPTTLVGDTIDENIANFLHEINIDAAVDENDAKLTNML